MVMFQHLGVTGAPKYTRKLDFTTGKRRNRGELPKIREADSLGQRTRAVEREYVGSHKSQH